MTKPDINHEFARETLETLAGVKEQDATTNTSVPLPRPTNFGLETVVSGQTSNVFDREIKRQPTEVISTNTRPAANTPFKASTELMKLAKSA